MEKSQTISPNGSSIVLQAPGQARCACGALLLKVCAPSTVEIKCRRCGRIVEVRMQAPKS